MQESPWWSASLTLIFEPGPGSAEYFCYRSLAICKDGVFRDFWRRPRKRIIYTRLPAFARMARDTVMRRAEIDARGKMGDDKHEEARSGRRTAHALRSG